VQVILPVLLVEIGARAIVETPLQQPVRIMANKAQCRAVVVPVAVGSVILVEIRPQDRGLGRTMRALGQAGGIHDRAIGRGGGVAVVTIGAVQGRRGVKAAQQLCRQVGRLVAPGLRHRVIA